MKKDFAQKVYDVVAAIPKGKVMSYGEVARRAGSSRAARAVGTIMHKNPDTKRVPCHRVVRSDRTVGGYAFGTEKKLAKLQSEGIVLVRGRINQGDIIS